MNFKNRKNLVFDLDGTLLNNDLLIPSETQKTMAELKKDGYKMYLNTGRPTKAIDSFMESNLFDGYATYNGAYVKIGKEVIENKVSVSKVLETLKKFDLGQYSLTTQIEDTLYVSNKTYIEDVIRRTNPGVVADIKTLPEDGAYSIRIVFPDSESAAHATKILIEGTSEYTIAHSTQIYVIVNDINASKLNIFDVIGKDECIFFGDSGNDLIVFEDKNIYCMCPNNSIQQIKDLADTVLEESNEGNILKSINNMG